MFDTTVLEQAQKELGFYERRIWVDLGNMELHLGHHILKLDIPFEKNRFINQVTEWGPYQQQHLRDENENGPNKKVKV